MISPAREGWVAGMWKAARKPLEKAVGEVISLANQALKLLTAGVLCQWSTTLMRCAMPIGSLIWVLMGEIRGKDRDVGDP